jgi:hypothetical protein
VVGDARAMLETSGSLPRAATARFAVASSTSGAHRTVAERIDQHDIPLARRLRSAVLLVLLVTGLGAVVAATLGVVVVALTTLVDHALA